MNGTQQILQWVLGRLILLVFTSAAAPYRHLALRRSLSSVSIILCNSFAPILYAK